MYSHNVDAMLIAEYIGFPIVNGMASCVPPGWNFSNPAQVDYLNRVEEYTEKHHLGNVCLLDLATLAWSRCGKLRRRTTLQRKLESRDGSRH